MTTLIIKGNTDNNLKKLLKKYLLLQALLRHNKYEQNFIKLQVSYSK